MKWMNCEEKVKFFQNMESVEFIFGEGDDARIQDRKTIAQDSTQDLELVDKSNPQVLVASWQALRASDKQVADSLPAAAFAKGRNSIPCHFVHEQPCQMTLVVLIGLHRQGHWEVAYMAVERVVEQRRVPWQFQEDMPLEDSRTLAGLGMDMVETVEREQHCWRGVPL